jgi:hypothetical protein
MKGRFSFATWRSSPERPYEVHRLVHRATTAMLRTMHLVGTRIAGPFRLAVRAVEVRPCLRRATRSLAREDSIVPDGSEKLHPRRAKRQVKKQGTKLARECEAFLTGRYARQLPRQDRWAWGWINTLAHGSRAQIEALSIAPVDRKGDAAAFTASEVLACQERYGWDLAWVQRTFLVPVELHSDFDRRTGARSVAARPGRGPIRALGGPLHQPIRRLCPSQ